MITEKANAKINLTLKILGKRNDGYHELNSVMVPLELADILTFEKSFEDNLISDYNFPDNIILKTVKLLREECKVKEKVKITLKKNIFIAAGLAGGSADASATLKGLNKLWELGLSDAKLLELGAKIGSDVPFMLKNSASIAKGRGEILTEIDNNLEAFVLLINPKYPVSTKCIFEEFKNSDINISDTSKEVALGLKNNDLLLIKNNWKNDLEQATFRLFPALKQLKKEIEEKENIKLLMSGSGPTLFTLDNDYDKLRRIAQKLSSKTTVSLTKVKK